MKILSNVVVDDVTNALVPAVPAILSTIQATVQASNEDDIIRLLERFDECVECVFILAIDL